MSRGMAEKKNPVAKPPRPTEVFNSILVQLSFCAEQLRQCHTTRAPVTCHEESLMCVNGLTTPKNGMKG